MDMYTSIKTFSIKLLSYPSSIKKIIIKKNLTTSELTSNICIFCKIKPLMSEDRPYPKYNVTDNLF